MRVAAVLLVLALAGAAKRKETKKPLRPKRSKHAARLAVNGRAPPLCVKEFDLCRARRPKTFAAKRDCLLAEHRAELTDVCVDYLELHGAGCNLVALHEMCPGAAAGELHACVERVREAGDAHAHAEHAGVLTGACAYWLETRAGLHPHERAEWHPPGHPRAHEIEEARHRGATQHGGEL